MNYAIAILYKNQDGNQRLAIRYVQAPPSKGVAIIEHIRRDIKGMGYSVVEICILRLDNIKPEQMK
jgi:hypothetical protein